MTRAGVQSLWITRRNARPRGLFCGIGVCYDCLLTVDGLASRARPGAGDRRHGAAEHPLPSGRWRLTDAHATLGRSWLSSVPVRRASPRRPLLARAGLSVVLIDAGGQPGRMPRHRPHQLAGRASGSPRLADLPPPTRSELEVLQDDELNPPPRHAGCGSSGLPRMPAGRMCCGSAPSMARPSAPAAPSSRRRRALSRGYDHQLPVPGWDLPGVMAAGGVQALLGGHGVVPGRRASRRWHRPVPAAGGDRPRRRRGRGGLGLRGRGAELVAPPPRRHPRGTVPSWSRARGTLRAAAQPRPVPPADRDHPDPRGPRSRGRHHRPGGPAGRPMVGTERGLAVDLVGLGWGPLLELSSAAGATPGSMSTVPRRLGDDCSATHYQGRRGRRGDRGRRCPSGVAEGELEGLTAAEDAGLPSAPRRTARLRRAIRRGRIFARKQCTVRTPCRPAGRSGSTTSPTVCHCEEARPVTSATRARGPGRTRPAHRASYVARPGWIGARARVWLRHRLPSARFNFRGEPRPPTSPADLRPLPGRPLCAPVSLGESGRPGRTA